MNSINSRDASVWKFANNLITDICIKISANTDIDAYVQRLYFYTR